MYGNQQAAPAMNSAMMQDNIQTRRIALAQQKARSIVSKYNKNPKKMSDEETLQAKAMGEAFGYSTARGDSKDTAGVWDAVLGFGGGAIDSILLGILKDEWYTNRQNGDYATAGRIAGIVGSLAVGGIPSLSKGAATAGRGIANTLSRALGTGKTASIANRVFTAYGKYGTAPGVASGLRGAAQKGVAAVNAGAGGRYASGAGAAGNWAKGVGQFNKAGATQQAIMNGLGYNAYNAVSGIAPTAIKYAPQAALGAGGLGLLGQLSGAFSQQYNEQDMLPQIPQQY